MLGARSGKWSMPLGLSTLRKHSTAVRTGLFKKARELRDARRQKANLTRRVGFEQYSKALVASPTESGDLSVGPSEYGPLPGQLLLHSVDDKNSNWLGVMTDHPDPGALTAAAAAATLRAKTDHNGAQVRLAPTAMVGRLGGGSAMGVTPPPIARAATDPQLYLYGGVVPHGAAGAVFPSESGRQHGLTAMTHTPDNKAKRKSKAINFGTSPAGKGSDMKAAGKRPAHSSTYVTLFALISEVLLYADMQT